TRSRTSGCGSSSRKRPALRYHPPSMRTAVLANGSLLVALDEFGRVADLYFPHVGLEAHAREGTPGRIGVYVDGMLSWLGEDGRWDISVAHEEEALAARVVARNEHLGVELAFTDVVYNESPIFIRRVVVKNLTDTSREIKVYLGQELEIYRSPVGDSAYYDPADGTIIHYKGQRVFLVGGTIDDAPLSDYAIGLTGYAEKEGTFRDAEDGALSKNSIEHGPVDSVVGFYGDFDAGAEKVIRYWLCAGDSLARAKELHAYLLKKKPDHLVRTSGSYWHAWVNKYTWSFHGMPPEQIALFKKSLMLVRAHVDDGGGIIASADSDTLQGGKDTYAYVWPRDAAYAAMTLDRAGDPNVARRFFSFCEKTIRDEGYFMHKYLPDGSLGSSWHPWIKDGKTQLPIQEDETALVIYALNEHYQHSKDLEFLESLFNPLVVKAADFMVSYRDQKTGLPLPSYDLWEEQRGVSTFTASAVYGALMAAVEMSTLLGKEKSAKKYRDAAESVKAGILAHLYDEGTGTFAKLLDPDTGVADRTLDTSSVYGVFAFGVLPADDPRLAKAFDAVFAALSRGVECGGIGRYEHDEYYRTGAGSNPWFVTTLWYAEYLTARARSEEELEAVRNIFTFVVERALPSGVLSEQLDAQTGAQLSVAPLTWSHSAYVSAVLKYLDKLEALGVCAACNPTP
ncbi:MAG TPA: glycoside hydrolase family 15 protein, partial [Candidatus Paceibacterota bacterium]|nr:glycoside hydrolase family 15 protein [Candidatus Paceibacterota bacterium]